MSSFSWPSLATGDYISGPTSAVDNRLVRFDGASGDAVKSSPITCDDSGNLSGVGTITTSGAVNGASPTEMGRLAGVTSAIQTQLNARLQLAGGTMTGKITLDGDPSSALHAATKQYVDTKLPLAGGTLTGFVTAHADPSSALHLATKQYVDAAINGVKVKEGVKAASTANLTLSGEQTIDGVSCVTGDRVLAKNQSTASQNGVYIVATGAWTRATDLDSAAEMNSCLVTVAQGSTLANTGWYQSAEVTTLGSDTVTFVQFFGAGTYTADGSSLQLSGSTFSVKAAGITNAMLAGSIAYSKLSLTGAILNADLAGSIADSKLATISTAGKVSGNAITSGTIGGTTVINTTGNITTTGNVDASSYSYGAAFIARGVASAGNSLSNLWSYYGAKIQGLSSNSSSLLVGYDGSSNVILQGAASSSLTRTLSLQPYGGDTTVGGAFTTTGNITTTDGSILGTKSTNTRVDVGMINTNTGSAAGAGLYLQTDGGVALMAKYSVAHALSDRLYILNETNGVYMTPGATSWTAASDERIKKIERHIDPVLEKLKSARTVVYTRTDDDNPKLQPEAGLIAQDWIDIIPEIVSGSEDTQYGLSYDRVTVALVKAIQELAAKVEALEARA